MFTFLDGEDDRTMEYACTSVVDTDGGGIDHTSRENARTMVLCPTPVVFHSLRTRESPKGGLFEWLR